MRFGSLTTCVSLVCAALLIASGARADELGRKKMGHYLIQAKFTDAAWASMAAKPQDRKELLAKVVGRLEGNLGTGAPVPKAQSPRPITGSAQAA